MVLCSITWMNYPKNCPRLTLLGTGKSTPWSVIFNPWLICTMNLHRPEHVRIRVAGKLLGFPSTGFHHRPDRFAGRPPQEQPLFICGIRTTSCPT